MRVRPLTESSSSHIRFRGRSFPVLAIEPDAPIDGWIEKLDACLERTPAFFARKAIVVDVSKLGLERDEVVGLMGRLSERQVRVMGLTGVEPSWACDELPPILLSGRAYAADEEPSAAAPQPTLTPQEQTTFAEIGAALRAEKPALAESVESERRHVAPLVVEKPVRSGQSIFHPGGDVIVVGSVASGADVVAGGSIHVYGAVRGRVMAGSYGETRARIFCRKLEAELVAVGGFYMTADEIRADLRGRAVHAFLQDETIKIVRLD
ncbi:septum site-determining protein MinC [Methylosinus sp. 3S-1]